MTKACMRTVRAMWAIFLFAQAAIAQQFPVFDFSDAKTVGEWRGNKQILQMEATKEGMSITVEGNDPFMNGPARNYPTDQLLWLKMRVKSEQGGVVQVFYFKDGAREENSVKAAVAGGKWEDVK